MHLKIPSKPLLFDKKTEQSTAMERLLRFSHRLKFCRLWCFIAASSNSGSRSGGQAKHGLYSALTFSAIMLS